MLRPRPEGGWTLSGNLAELAGAEFMEIFSWFLEAEWQTDWADARNRLGDTATTTRPRPDRTATARRRPAGHGPCRRVDTTGLATTASDDERVDRPGHLRSPPTRRDPRPRRLRQGRVPHPHRTTPAPRRRRQHRPHRPHPPRRLRHHRHRHRPRPPIPTVPRVRPRRRHAVTHQLCLDRLRPTHPLVRRRPQRRLESTRRHRPPQRQRTLPTPQPTQRTQATTSTATPTATGTPPTPTATPSPDPPTNQSPSFRSSIDASETRATRSMSASHLFAAHRGHGIATAAVHLLLEHLAGHELVRGDAADPSRERTFTGIGASGRVRALR